MLDMGKPVRILELARKMVKLAGLTPGEDIEIRITGARPGEKLFEELSLDAESLLPTSHHKIRIYQGRQVTFGDLAPSIAELQHLLWRGDPDAVLAHLRTLAPEYHPIPDLVPVSVVERAPITRARPQVANVYTSQAG